MITLSSVSTATFKPFADVKLETQRLAGLLLAGVPLPPKFTEFVVRLADLLCYETSDTEMNECFRYLKETLLEDELLLLPKVYDVWLGVDLQGRDCLEYLYYSIVYQYPRLKLSEEIETLRYIALKSQELVNNYGVTFPGVVNFIRDNKGRTPPPHNVKILDNEAQKIDFLLNQINIGQPVEIGFNQLARKRKSISNLEKLFEHLTQVFPVVTNQENYNFMVLFYFARAHAKVSSRIVPFDQATSKLEAEALESYRCLSQPLEFFEIAKKDELETQAGAVDMTEVFEASYVHEALEYMEVRDLYSYQKQLCIDRSMGLFTENPQDLISTQQAIFKGYIL